VSDPTEQTGEFLLSGDSIARIDGQNFEHLANGMSSRDPGSPNNERKLALQEVLRRDVHDRILASTRNILVEHGWGSLNLDAIICGAGIDEKDAGPVRENFTSASLAILLLEQFHTPLIALFSSAMGGAETILSSIEKMGRSWISLIRRDLPLYRAFFELNVSASSQLDRDLQDGLVSLRTKTQTIFKGLLAEGQLRGEIRKGSVDVMATTISGCFMGLISNLSMSDKLAVAGIYAEDLIDDMLVFSIHGLKA
jgi:hypothetical protein